MPAAASIKGFAFSGAALRHARTERGLTRYELERKTILIGYRVASETIEKYEMGMTTEPSFERVAALAEALGVEMEVFLVKP